MKQTSPRISTLASRLIKRPETATLDEIKSLAASVLGQDENNGQRGKQER